jgi:PadR family transcriptional regulator PadR
MYSRVQKIPHTCFGKGPWNLSDGRNVDMFTVDMSKAKSDIPHGSLDLLILRVLDTMGAVHGYAIARRLEQVTGGSTRLSQGAIYPALIRLEQQGRLTPRWGVSETNREVKFYELTPAGAAYLREQIVSWEQSTALIARFLGARS